MNILINFRYISMDKRKDEIISEVYLAEELEVLAELFKEIASGYKILQIKPEEFYENNKIHLDAKNLIRAAVETCTKEFNLNNSYKSYLWLDEICTIFIEGIKAYPLEDASEYVNFKDLKNTIQECICELAEKGKIDDLVNYSEIFFVIYLDIIEREIPFFREVVQI